MSEDQPSLIELPASPAPGFEDRRCATCACSIKLPNPRSVTGEDTYCRRNVPITREDRVRGPDPSNPRKTVEGIQRLIEHELVHANAVCFDGWRPIGTPPGENYALVQLAPLLEQLLDRLTPRG